MANRFVVKDMTFENSRMLCTLSNPLVEYSGLQASGRMLADSDRLSFVYIIDSGDGYLYIEFPSHLWPDLKKTLDEKCDVFIRIDSEKTFELQNFRSELVFLIDNIADNPNYGENMPTEVVKRFHTK